MSNSRVLAWDNLGAKEIHKDVAALGGWRDTTTLQKCCQVADERTMEAVVL